MESGERREAAGDLFVGLRAGGVAELHPLGDEVLHDDDALPRLWVELGKVAGRMGQRDVGIDVAIAPHLALVHVVVDPAVRLEAALDDDQLWDARPQRRLVAVQPQADLAAGGKDGVDDLAPLDGDARRPASQRRVQPTGRHAFDCNGERKGTVGHRLSPGMASGRGCA